MILLTSSVLHMDYKKKSCYVYISYLMNIMKEQLCRSFWFYYIIVMLFIFYQFVVFVMNEASFTQLLVHHTCFLFYLKVFPFPFLQSGIYEVFFSEAVFFQELELFLISIEKNFVM